MSLSSSAKAAAHRPQLPAAGEVIGLFTESVAHRAELAALELEEARGHAVISSVMACVALVLVLLTGMGFTVFVAGAVWESPHRTLWLGVLCAAYLMAAVAVSLVLTRRLRSWRPMGETQGQLQRDYQCLSQLFRQASR
ncbi:MAG TPA: phage holin family protein [Candidatus Didemnitutus sp.]|nr:phage holin family protein [Candidatus Didemnitutus sp.]